MEKIIFTKTMKGATNFEPKAEPASNFEINENNSDVSQMF